MFARRCVYVRNRPQPSATVATVRNRPQRPSARGRYGRAYGKFCKSGHFWRFHMMALLSFRVAGVALRDIQTCFVTCRKSFCVAGAILLRRFQKMRCSFQWQAQHFGRVHRHFTRGTRSTLDVSCCVFFANPHCQGCVKWRQGANSVAGVAFCEM